MRGMTMTGVATALMLASAPVALLAKPAPAAPAATPFKLGALTLVPLRDMLNVVPNDGSVFGKGLDPAQVAAVLAKAGAPIDSLTLGVDALLVEMPGRTVLIDTGLGPKVGGVLQASLAAAHVAPDAVTDVLITHSHGDHIGGLLTADGALAFPNATIRMAAAEWGFLKSHPASAATVAAIAAKVQTFAPGAEVVPGIRSIALAGHTPGHSGYEIVSQGQRLIDIGDTAHSAIVSLAEPDWAVGYDTDAKEGEATRRAELTKLAASHEWVFAPHFPYPGTGRIVAKGSGFAFVPGHP
jgi:glyoxylase-like metal-dependent hydrolase (beta-lactamase superfamily II)